MPLTCAPTFVTTSFQCLSKHDVIVGDSFACVHEMKKVLASHEYSSTWHTYGHVGTTQDIGVTESRSIFNEPVHIWSLDYVITQRSNSVEPLVIGKEKEDIRPIHS